MGCLIALGLLVLIFGIGTFLTLGLAHLLLTLFIAGMVGALADAVVPGKLPGGFLGAILAGIAGGFVGTFLLNLIGMSRVGPSLFNVPLIPAFVGAVVIAVVAELLSKNDSARRYMEMPGGRR
jgi:uncharacterized membrane protein YeaQ/YmgE (transglycosylase-associated protein family)